MKEPKWISRIALELLSQQSLATFGGADGMRDAGLLDSALARPQNLFASEADVTLAKLAACYAVGITRNHAFADGNKRAGLLALLIFLEINGFEVIFEKVDAIQTMFAVAAGEITEEQLSTWISERMRRLPKSKRR